MFEALIKCIRPFKRAAVMPIWPPGKEATHGDQLVRVVHHGDEHVEQHHQRDDVVRAEHRRPHELRELVARLHVGDVEVQQPEDRPEQRLERLEQPGDRERPRQRGGPGETTSEGGTGVKLNQVNSRQET